VVGHGPCFWVLIFYILTVTRYYHRETSPVVMPEALRRREYKARHKPSVRTGINLREEKKEKVVLAFEPSPQKVEKKIINLTLFCMGCTWIHNLYFLSF
jgi:hypothetical protein